MIKLFIRFLYSAIVICLCFSCRIQKNSNVETFFNTYITPIELNGAAIPDTEEDSRLTLIFHTAENRIGGYSGCNNYFGDFQLKGKTITFSKIGATKRACIGAGDTLERALFSVLRSTNAINADKKTLQLLNGKKIIGKFVILNKENQQDK